jgi:hypothetical protein
MNASVTHYTYVAVRGDLTGAQALVQAGHATYEAARRFDPDGLATHLVAIVVKDRDALLELSLRLREQGVEHHLFFEPDNGMGESALATRPVASNKERKLFRGFPLYGGRHER